jgi:hypothetical protein
MQKIYISDCICAFKFEFHTLLLLKIHSFFANLNVTYFTHHINSNMKTLISVGFWFFGLFCFLVKYQVEIMCDFFSPGMVHET